MRRTVATIFPLLTVLAVLAASPKVAYDPGMAREICDELPLENVEGIWIYPDDHVTVMILKDKDTNATAWPTYTVSVVETSDARLHPGDIVGKLKATPRQDTFSIELMTEKKNDYLLKPKSVLATLSKDGDSFLIKRQKAPFKGRLNLSLNRLLPGFWKIVSIGVSQNNNRENIEPPVGMIKIYPSYDGNGSSRRRVRYL